MLYVINAIHMYPKVHNGRKYFYLDIREIFPYHQRCRLELKGHHKKDTQLTNESNLDSNKDRVVTYL
jgi:hypothetical protein